MRDQYIVASMLFFCLPACLSVYPSQLHKELGWTSAVAQTDILTPASRLQALAYKQPTPPFATAAAGSASAC